LLPPPSGNPARMSVTDLAATPFRWGSAIRHARVFHPDGLLVEGSIERSAPADAGLPIPSCDVVARVSKAVGTPGAWPDIIGLALRIPPQADDGAAWDILLASAGSGVLTRAVGLRPVISWTGHTMTSLMPLRYQGSNWWLRAEVTTEISGSGVSLDSVRDQLRNGTIDVTLEQACGRSAFEQVGHLTLHGLLVAPHGGDVSFDPVLHTAPGVELYPGWLATLRARAYDRSRDGRDAD
jgi:hypothetical protein